MIKQLLLVGVGGGIGSVLRFLASWLTVKSGNVAFPMATLTVNLVGCLLIGLFTGWAMKHSCLDANLRLLLITGFCGGFTTFSAFSLENIQLFQAGQYVSLVLYVLASVGLGFAAASIGLLITK
ncbi:MAG: fluoride efflux transporter CrcB [Dysgonamonadaceae bacterium]|jgi:CrcB protein|nr:fluoride efflux transporter CrcB [Dysgonamonadaceae bacterium]